MSNRFDSEAIEIEAQIARELKADAMIRVRPAYWIAAALRSAYEQGVEDSANAARDCAIYDGGDRLLNSDIRKTCADAIRALKANAKTPPNP